MQQLEKAFRIYDIGSILRQVQGLASQGFQPGSDCSDRTYEIVEHEPEFEIGTQFRDKDKGAGEDEGHGR